MGDLVLGVDCSTTASKVIAWDRSGKAVGTGRAPLTEIRPSATISEQEAEDWWEATSAALREVTVEVGAARVDAICITHQRESFVAVDADQRSLRNAILWDDARAQAQLDEIGERFGHEELHRRTGRGPSLTQALPKLLWLVQHEPEIAQRAVHFMDTHGYLVQRLCGEITTSLASADSFGLTDVEQDAWATDLIEAIGLRPDQFCETVRPGTVVGELHERAAEQTGLQAGTAVIAGLGDGQGACLGAGVVTLDRAALNLGTAVTGGPVSDHYLSDPSCRTMYAGAPGTFLLEECLRGGMATMTWFMGRFGDGYDEEADFDRYEAQSREVGPGARGLMLVPYFNGVMSPHWEGSATGMIVGWRLDHGREHLFRAVQEGIAYEFRLAMEGIQQATGERIGEYVILGGGSNSDLWCQIIADVLAVPVVRARSVEATCLGAGVLGAYGANWFDSVADAAAAMTDVGERFEPDERSAGIYDELFDGVYTGLYRGVASQLHRLGEIRHQLEAQ